MLKLFAVAAILVPVDRGQDDNAPDIAEVASALAGQLGGHVCLRIVNESAIADRDEFKDQLAGTGMAMLAAVEQLGLPKKAEAAKPEAGEQGDRGDQS
jgi:hypothetical protein